MEKMTICGQCGKGFEAKRADAKYCSSTCRSRACRVGNGEGDSSELGLEPDLDDGTWGDGEGGMIASPVLGGTTVEAFTRAASAGPSSGGATLHGSAETADLEARIAALEARNTTHAMLAERVARIDVVDAVLDRLGERVAAVEAGRSEAGELASRVKQLEAERSKAESALSKLNQLEALRTTVGRLNARLEAQEAQLAAVGSLQERLRALERRPAERSDLPARVEALERRGATERSDLPARVEALEQQRQVVLRLQRSITELQTKLDTGLDELRARRGLDSVGVQRIVQAQLAPVEQRMERVASQLRPDTSHEESMRLTRLEQRVERLATRPQADAGEDLPGRLKRIERQVATLNEKLTQQSADNDTDETLNEHEQALLTLNGRLNDLRDDLSSLQQSTTQLARALVRMRGISDDDDDDE